MSLYSSNRLFNLDPEYKADKLNEEVTVAPEVEAAVASVKDESDNEISFDGIDSDVEDNKLNENHDGLLNSLLQIGENDLNVFTSMLNTDFLIACENLTLGKSINESNYNSNRIWELRENINKVITFAESAIKSDANDTISKTQKLNNKDKSIAKKFKSVINKENIKEFAGIPQFSFPSSAVMESIDELGFNNELTESTIEAIEKICESNNINEIEYKMSILGEVYDVLNLDVNSKVDTALEKTTFIPNEEQIDIIKSYTESEFVKYAMNNSAYTMISNLKSIRDKVNESLDSFTESEFDVYKANKLYEAVSCAAKTSLKQFNTYKDIIVRENASLRKANIVIGKFALESSKGNKPDISELDMYNVCENSDTYVFALYTEEEDPISDKDDSEVRDGEEKYASKETEGIKQEVIDAAQE